MRGIRWLSFLLLVGIQGILSGPGSGAEPSSRLLAVASAPEKGGRIAIVIGNSSYPSGALANPKNDATAMAASLRKLGFDVELKLDASKADMDAVFKRLSAKAESAGVAALFYAGHGIQVSGSNYLVPIDANPKNERDLKREMVRMDDVIDDMGNARVKLVFFDACRDNPLTRSFSRGGVRGMAAPVEATGTLISFATKHGNTAADGEGQHSPYTTALLAALENPGGVEIEQLLRKVQQGVKQATNGQQEPWRYGSLDGDFYLQAPAAPVDSARLQQEVVDRAVLEAMKRASEQATAEALRRAAEQQARDREASAAAVELSYWDSIKSSQNADDFRAYVRRYPQGAFVDLAQNRMAALEREEKRRAEEAGKAAKPAASPLAADQTAVELAFWDSIKSSSNGDDFKEYLASYPQGRFAGLARSRIRSLGAAAVVAVAKPAPPASSPPAAESSPQLAMITPSKPALAAAPASGFPQIGDSWTYRYVDAWKKGSPQTVVVKVQESDASRVTDVMSLRGGRGSDERSYDGRLEVAERAVGGGVRVIELLPYLQVPLRDGWQPGQQKGFPDIALGSETYRVTAKLVGREKVSVAAGGFDAWRVEIVGQRIGSALSPGQQAVATSFRHLLWFAPEIRRVVKVEHTSGNLWRTRLDDDTLELVSSVVSGQAYAQTPAPATEIVPPQPAPAQPSAAAYPRQGDSWTYRYVDRWKKDNPRTITVRVHESDAGRVTDRMSMRDGRGADERTYEGKPDAAERSVARDVRVVELLPYAQGLLQEGMQPGQERDFPDLALGGETYRVKAKLVGPGKVSVPAGTFDAVRVDIVGQRVGGPLIPAQQGVAGTFMHTLWFAPEIRRVVKVEHTSGNPWRARLDDETLELISFTLR